MFFPEFSETAGTLAAFATFGIGFFARPVGGIVFGHFGDRVGRKTMLVLTLTIMGVATTLTGLLPTYVAIGVAAPLLLVVLRCAAQRAARDRQSTTSNRCLPRSGRGGTLFPFALLQIAQTSRSPSCS